MVKDEIQSQLQVPTLRGVPSFGQLVKVLFQLVKVLFVGPFHLNLKFIALLSMLFTWDSN